MSYPIAGKETLLRWVRATGDKEATFAVESVLAELEAKSTEVQLLRGVAAAAERLCDRSWFNPAEAERGACSHCDANLHPNCIGKHAQLDGSPCELDELHSALIKLEANRALEGKP